MDVLEAREVLSTLVVTNTNDSGPGSLRKTVLSAVAGDVVTFDSSLNGQTIKWQSSVVTISKNIQIVGPGKELLTLDGNHAQLFEILAPATNVTISGLTLANGQNKVEGGAIVDRAGPGSSLILRSDAFVNNDVEGDNARGGAISKAKGTLTIDSCLFQKNTVETLPGHGNASGAAVFAQGRLIVTNSTFQDGLVQAGTLPSQIFATPGGNGRGGAIAYSAATGAVSGTGRNLLPGVLIQNSKFHNNIVDAGYGATLDNGSTNGGNAYGGAVSIEANNVNSLNVHVIASMFKNNSAYGGAAGDGVGGALPAHAGNAWGGGLWLNAGSSHGLSFLVDQRSSFDGNLAEGGNGQTMPAVADPKLLHSRPAGDGHGGGIAIAASGATSATFSIKHSTFDSSAEGGHGGWIQAGSTDIWAADSGNGHGGGVWINAGHSSDCVFSIVSDTFAGSQARGGFAGSVVDSLGSGGDGGFGEGGGIDFHGGISLRAKLSIGSSVFQDVAAIGGTGGNAGTTVPTDFAHGVNIGGRGGDARGGGIAIDYERSDKTGVVLAADTLTGTKAQAWTGGIGGPSLDSYNGHGGTGGNAYGGAIYVTVDQASRPGFSILGGSISQSVASAGRGGAGGKFVGSRFSLAGPGGDGGMGGSASGGGIYLDGSVGRSAPSQWSILDLAIDSCTASAGYGGTGGDGLTGGKGGQSGIAQGGGIFTGYGGPLRIQRCDITDNDVVRALGGQGGKGATPAKDGATGIKRAVHGPALAVAKTSGTVSVIDTTIDSGNSKTTPWVYDPMLKVQYS